MANLQSSDYYSGNKISLLIIYALSYASGILFHIFFKAYFYGALITLLVTLLLFFLKHRSLHQTLALISLFLAIGYFNTSLNSPDKNHLLQTYKNEGLIFGKINSKIQQTAKGYYKFTIASKQLVIENKRENCYGSILVYTKELPSSIHYNDYILLNKNITLVNPPQNPNEFNYKRYLNFHDIYFSTFCSLDDFSIIPNETFSIIKLAHQTQVKLSNYLLSKISSEREKQTISALVLGLRDELDKEVIANFSAAGAMHVLAVSGLHVGILLMIIRFFFKHIAKELLPKWFEVTCTLFLIWTFAFITGLSASVVRAACMFSFIICGTYFKKDISIYPILAASALCMMVYNPYIITEVGFQLSYAAVIGIVFFTPKLESTLPTSNNWLFKKIITITCVSVAAQLATAPIALLYFHQFPTYFILSNLIVIPSAFLIVITGIIKLIFGFIPFLNTLIAEALFWFSWLLNEVSEITALLPSATINQIDISILETYLFYGVVVSLFVALFNRNHHAIKWALFFVVLLSIAMINEHYSLINQQQLVVYNVRKATAFDLIKGKEHFFKVSSSLLNDDEKLQFHIKHHWYHKNLTPAVVDTSFSAITTYEIGNKTIVHVTKKITLNESICTDYLIISNNSMTTNEVIKNFTYKQLIYDSSNGHKFISKVKQRPQFSEKTVITSEQGAVVIDL